MHHPCVGMAFAICDMFTLVLSASIQKGQILNIVEASWIGEVGGHAFQLNGTAGVQSPFGLAQLKATHPEIELPKNTNDALAAVENLAKRNKVSCYAPLFQQAADFLCLSDHPSTLSPMSSHPDWQEAEIFDVGVCAGFLFGINARISVGAGRGTCAQICCDDGDKVFACNDNSYAIDPASSYLASYVLDIVSDCWDQFGDTVGGQEFDTDDYNVIVRGNGGNDGSC
ncbi:hypothetical protein L207DRAFT_532119 [Hyaloscypha variabilis F]|uniref:Uncharacterized protein n=1 Tax=Hyaloscypha variabilis (strain UAMH 11265 / GT02V1 / F) TaxID=1149755 RepID=A0A2J6RDA1_HYAVF|nr:hypothetical protein L207DRAFT_532119 [Hyaloscypha variabilis F]